MILDVQASHIQMCTCVYTLPDVRIRVCPPPEGNDSTREGHLQAHPPPDGYTNTYLHTSCARTYAPTPHYTRHSPRCAHPISAKTGGCREQEAFSQLMRGGGRGREPGRGPHREPSPGSPARPPSSLTVDARLVRHGSPSPSEPPIGPGRDTLAGPVGGGCGGGR